MSFDKTHPFLNPEATIALCQTYRSEGVKMNTIKQDNKQKDDKSSSSENPESSGDEPPGSDLKAEVEEDSHWSIILAGEWQEVTEACSDFTDKLEKVHSYGNKNEDELLQEWSDWCPRNEDDEEELVKRTATQARFEPDKPPAEHLEKSKSHFTAFQEKVLIQGETSYLQKLGRVFKNGITAFISIFGFSLGKLEEFLYRKVVLRANPFYFDNSLISASFEKTNRFEVNEDDRYKLKVKIHDEETKDSL